MSGDHDLRRDLAAQRLAELAGLDHSTTPRACDFEGEIREALELEFRIAQQEAARMLET